jgi:hypothetical protein
VSRTEQIENHQRYSDRNGGVGDVEGPEVPAAPVKVEEVQHIPRIDPVDEVAADLNGISSAFKRPNAAPVLWTRVRLKNPGMTSILSNRFKRGRTAAFTT